MRVLDAAFAASALTLGLLYTAPDARANGRFPKAQAIVLPAGGDGNTIYLRATFGVLVSRDAGTSWHWLCERALGFASTWDPPIASTRDGRLWVALSDGAHVTRDGCTVDDVPSVAGETLTDLAVDGSGERVFAVSSTPGKPSFVWAGRGAPPTFAREGSGVTGFRFDTIEIAPSRPSRLYLTAVPQGRGKSAHLFRSDDGGATLTELSPVLANDARLYVSAVDPHDPDRLYLRALSASGSDVLLSTDGGKTLKTVLHMKGAMFGFARSRDGAILYAGSGDPAEGIQRSVDRGATWQAGAKTSVFCLNADGPRLLVCSNPYVPGGYAVAESLDRGDTVKPLATFEDVIGPVDCDGGSPCTTAWPETRAAIAASANLPRVAPSAPLPQAARPIADAGRAAGGGRSRACGCVVAGGAPGDASLPSSLLALFLGLVALVRGAGRRAQHWIAESPEPLENGPPR